MWFLNVCLNPNYTYINSPQNGVYIKQEDNEWFGNRLEIVLGI